MKKIIIICLLCALGIKGYSQLLEDKANFYIGYQTGIFSGNELFNDNGTISPAFYSNLTSNNGLNIKYVLNVSSYFSTGFKVELLNATDWESKNYSSYNNSTSITFNLQPLIQIHNRFQKNGLYNRLKLYGEISPVIGLSLVNMDNNIFDINGSGVDNKRLSSKNLIWGLSAGVGSEYAFTNKTGVFLDFSVQEILINSPLFLDNRYTLLGFNAGIRINISKVKRFNY